jgi:hypothetical protein
MSLVGALPKKRLDSLLDCDNRHADSQYRHPCLSTT